VSTRFGLPTVLMVNQRTRRLMDHANAAGVTTVVEKPLLGGVLFEAIRSALDGNAR
jgi:AmiR/NasT family two-component response regulator